MKYCNMLQGIFLKRPNRFLAHVEVNGQVVVCHVKNTGRCRELLIEGTRVLVQYHPEAKVQGRKTEYSLISVYKGELLINMDSQAPNYVAKEWLEEGGFYGLTGSMPQEVRREVTYSNSRFDLAFRINEKMAYMEVKGVTLECDGVALFPDAPTERGVKHIEELIMAAQNGYAAYILFVIQMKGIRYFTPNYKTHRLFGEALQKARQAGVTILAFDCVVSDQELKIDHQIQVKLEP